MLAKWLHALAQPCLAAFTPATKAMPEDRRPVNCSDPCRPRRPPDQYIYCLFVVCQSLASSKRSFHFRIRRSQAWV